MKKVMTLAMVAMFASAVAGYASCGSCKGDEKGGDACKKDQACRTLSIKDGKATCCACAKECSKCGEVKDGKCACGKAVTTCDLAGKFVCEHCKFVATKAGKCACGADLVEVKAKAVETK
jgi:hypothetical protein